MLSIRLNCLLRGLRPRKADVCGSSTRPVATQRATRGEQHPGCEENGSLLFDRSHTLGPNGSRTSGARSEGACDACDRLRPSPPDARPSLSVIAAAYRPVASVERARQAASSQSAFLIFSTISPSSGNRPASYFEKTVSPSTITSKMPFPPPTNSGWTPNCSLISAARPAALGL